ncbi:MAG: LLM class flavin-dependent oxidoreductase, partial [Chloroflexi bacterium]|nr:LLM class flavin-dependent oxidoreductase [Chloroflexota bacterium]
MKDLTVGVHIAGNSARELLDGIVAAEAAGVQVAWQTSGGLGVDPLAVFAAAALKTERIQFGTSIVQAFLRHPLSLVESATTVDVLAPGRLRLGIGTSHGPRLKGEWGIDFDRPLELLCEYLLVLKQAFEQGRIDFQGERFQIRAQLDRPAPVKVMAAALQRNTFRACGKLSDGAISWVCPLPYLRDVAVPALKDGAAAAGRETPPLIAHVPVAVSEDAAAVKAVALQRLATYPKMPFYARMFEAAGFPEAREGTLSERMVDALVVHGSAEQVKERLRQLPSFGAAELLAMPL